MGGSENEEVTIRLTGLGGPARTQLERKGRSSGDHAAEARAEAQPEQRVLDEAAKRKEKVDDQPCVGEWR